MTKKKSISVLRFVGTLACIAVILFFLRNTKNTNIGNAVRVEEHSYNDAVVLVEPEFQVSQVVCWDSFDMDSVVINHSFLEVVDYKTEYINSENTQFRVKFPIIRNHVDLMENPEFEALLNNNNFTPSGDMECYGLLDIKINLTIFDEGYVEKRSGYDNEYFDVYCRELGRWDCRYYYKSNDYSYFPMRLIQEIDEEIKRMIVR